MKAIIHTAYGPPDELQLQEVERPVAGPEEVLIKIHATTVTTSDCNLRNLTFSPRLFVLPVRIQFGLFRPKVKILGIDFAGEVESVGRDVTEFSTGDQVFGRPDPAFGAHAEYIRVPEQGVLAMKPANLSWEEAAAIPLAGTTALYFIRDVGNLQAGQEILIHGASGAIGTYAVQLAKHYGAEVTGVCSSRNVELVESLGADRVVDYTKEDFAKAGRTYDVIFDVVGKLPYARARSSLKEGGFYMTTLPTAATLLQMTRNSLMGGKRIKTGDAVGNRESLSFLKDLAEAGKLRSVIDRRYPLEQMAEAYRYVEQGHKVGNVVVTVSHDGGAPQASR